MSEKSAIEIPIYNNVVEFLALQDPAYTININDIVYFNETNNRWEKAIATEKGKTQGIGYVRSSNASNFLVVLFGLVNIEATNPLYNTLIPGKIYYLSDTVDGTLVSNEFLLQYYTLQRVGVCVGNNLLLVLPQDYRENNDLKIRTASVDPSVVENDAVYFNVSTDNWEKAYASSDVSTIASGFVLEKDTVSGVYTIILGGVITKTIPGLIVGQTYYLSTTPGTYTNDLSTIANAYYFQEIFRVIDSTNILFLPKETIQSLTTGILDLLVSDTNVSVSRFDMYRINMNTTPVANINFTNGLVGKKYILQITSDGTPYTWGTNMFWPSDILPLASDANKVDIFEFICVGPNKFLGTYGLNYS